MLFVFLRSTCTNFDFWKNIFISKFYHSFLTLFDFPQKRFVSTKFYIYIRMYYYHSVDTSAGGLLTPEGIIHTAASVLVLI